MAALIDGIRFRPEKIGLDPGIYAAGRANRLVIEEGLSFREAYRRVAQGLGKDD
jgi:argininosuccinate lyase